MNIDIFNPSLTAVMQPAFEMGEAAAELLINIIESKKPVTHFEKLVLDTKLIIRDSSKKR